MKNLLKNTIIFFSVWLFSPAIFGLSSQWSEGEASKVRLISPFTHNNNQEKIILGLEYEMDPGWKTYWQSPGDGGFPQNIVWDESINVKDIKLQWPKPKEFQILGLNSIGYEDKVIFPIEVKIENKSKITNLDISINYLICKDICIPGNARIFLDVPPGLAKTTEYYYVVEKAQSSIPLKNKDLSFIKKFETRAFKDKNKILLEVNAETYNNFENPKIFIHTPFGLPVVDKIIDYSLDYKSLIASFSFEKKLFSKEDFEIEVLLIDKNHNYSFVNKIKLEELAKYKFYQNPLLFYILISLIAGVILNVMPCVLPVLSIKLMSVLTADIKKTRTSFLITSIGIVSSFVLLGLIFLLLKQLNVSISWGMQFQQPYFLVIITSIIFLFMMNLFGQFELQMPNFINNIKFINAKSNSYTKDYFNGFFATLMATPCSAPFVGTAITAAFTQSSLISIMIFLFMGIGMSSPYLLITLFPKLIFFVPKPGKWMQYIKVFLGFLLFFTTIWLANILLNFFNYYYFIISILLLIILIYRRKILYFRNSLTFIILLLFLILPIFSFLQQNQKYNIDKDWQDFDTINFNKLIATDIVFVDITADWCATCQFNKLNVLNSKNVIDLLKNNNVILVRGDWTKPNEKINIFLNNYNKFGIPFNAFFSNNYPEGIILSELISEKEIVSSINKLKK